MIEWIYDWKKDGYCDFSVISSLPEFVITAVLLSLHKLGQYKRHNN